MAPTRTVGRETGESLSKVKMRPGAIVVSGVASKRPPQTDLAKDGCVIETAPAYRSDKALNISILPGRSGCRRANSNTHGP